MSFSMLPILIYSEQVPAASRSALRAAYGAPPDRRAELLERAVRMLHRETGLDCAEVRELVGMS